MRPAPRGPGLLPGVPEERLPEVADAVVGANTTTTRTTSTRNEETAP